MEQVITLHRPKQAAKPFAPKISGHNRVELQLFTTLNCNLKCTYCSAAVGEVLHSQGHVEYSLEDLDRFIETQLKDYDVYVTFYGGEPVMNREFMQEVMQRHPQFRFQLQTNGTLIDNLPESVLNKLSNVLISVDGGEHITDHFRGKGVYKQVVKNLGKVRGSLGGSTTARMTWSSPDTTFEEIDSLLENFGYIYWQFMQAEGGYDPDGMTKKKAVLRQLVARFFLHTDQLYPVIPLMGIVRNKVRPDILAREHGNYSQCRVSTHIINVLPDGRIFPCPDMAWAPELQQGDLRENWLTESPLQPRPEMPCHDCSAFGFCRYNCMKNLYRGYVHGDNDYRVNVVEPICELVRFLGEEIDRHNPAEWYAKASAEVREEIESCPVYEYVEIMP